MPVKREITIHLITTSPQSRVSSIVNEISELADDITITCKVLGRTTEPTRRRTLGSRRSGSEANGAGEPKLDGPQLAYSSDPEANHKRYIDVEASLKKLGLTREELMLRTWARGSPQHRLKRAASHQRQTIAHAAQSNGAKIGN
jgi:hypothetical protein